jgi:hypothetical protein
MKIHAITTALVLILTAAVAAPAAAREQRPMRGQFTAQAAAADQRCGLDALTLGFEISGVATHFGRLSGSGSNCTEFSLGTEAVAIWDGVATITAADGSTVTTVSVGTQDAPVAGIADFATTHTVTGGTGRFADAAGTWIVSGVINFSTGGIDGSVSGWLSY